jgi:hypothetical protein
VQSAELFQRREAYDEVAGLDDERCHAATLRTCTAYLLRSPANAKRLTEAVEVAERSETEAHDLDRGRDR